MISIITISNSRTKLLKTFEGVIRSIKENGIKNSEYIIVEVGDRGVLGTLECDKNTTVKHIMLKKGGFSIQRNIAVKESSNDIIVFIDDGMDIPPQWIQKIVSPIISNESEAVMGAVIPKIIQDDSSPSTIFKNIIILSQAVLGFPAGGMKLLSKGKSYIEFFSTSNLAILKKLIVDVGMFDENLVFGAEDSDISLRIKQNIPDARFFYSDEAYVFAEPREKLNDIRRWFLRRGKSLATLVKKYETSQVKMLLKRELLLPKIIPCVFVPPLLLGFLAVYINQAEKILEQSSSNPFFPQKYKRIMKVFLPLVKLYMDVWYSIGYYSEIFKSKR